MPELSVRTFVYLAYGALAIFFTLMLLYSFGGI